MAQQLIYTSCPVSLVRGRSGFSTVARGAGMGEALASMVERCSSYDSSAVSGPVFSHRIVRCGSSNWHVLTRTCDCGTDYTNRNNYIAHHLVLSEDEAAGLACNSAQIMLYWDGWLDSWSGEPRYIDDVDLSGIPAPAELPARRWEKIFSDAGCAACLSESGGEIRGGRKDSPTILGLFAESLSLFVNPLDSWRVTYTTCYFGSDNSADFLWKGISASGQPPKPGVADLASGTAPELPNCRAAEYARTGELNNIEKFNLKAAKPEFGARRFEVVVPERRAPGSAAIILSGVVVALAILVAALLFVNFAEGAERFPADCPGTPAGDCGGIQNNLAKTQLF